MFSAINLCNALVGLIYLVILGKRMRDESDNDLSDHVSSNKG
jgi:hypothetical protein